MKRHGLLVESDRSQDMQYANHVRKAILRGFFMNVAIALPTKNQFMTVKDNVKALLFPSTFLNRRPQFVVFNELVLTSNTYIRTVTAVSDDWLLEACPSYFDLDDFDGVARQVLEPVWKKHKQAQQRGHDESSRKRTRAADGSESD
jgi:pre-mRNA-splicing factor ATP-dependent RNA helicase DHX15/PRP43